MTVTNLYHTADEANDIAQSLHHYRLIVFSNVLTTVGTVEQFEPTLADVLADAQPGCMIAVLGAKGGLYPDIYRYVDGLAKTAGFRLLLQDEKVSPQLDARLSQRQVSSCLALKF
jgi:hypothetical protein